MSNRRTRGIVFAAAVSALSTAAMATDYTWANFSGLGSPYAWELPANWSPAGIPDDTVAGPFDDTADIRGDVTGADLNISLAVDHYVYQLYLGDTVGTNGVTVSGPGKLGLSGDGGALGDTGITSAGGGANVVSAPINMISNFTYQAASTNGLTLAGNIQPSGGGRELRNRAVGQTLTINGNILLWDPTAVDAGTGSLLARAGTISGTNAAITTTIINGKFLQGDGVTQQTTGTINFRGAGTSAGSEARFILNADNAGNYTGDVRVDEATVVLGHDNALGTASRLRFGNGNAARFLSHVQSDNDARSIAADVFIQGGNAVFSGDHSLHITGQFFQSNNRNFINVLPAGKTLTTDGTISVYNQQFDGSRTWVFDGSGETVVNSIINDDNVGGASIDPRQVRKQGTGDLVLNNGSNSWNNGLIVDGGLVKLGTVGAWGPASMTVNTNGAVAFVPGLADASFSTFTSAVNPASTGALAIAAGEAATSIDFTTLNGASGLSLGSQDATLSYSGAITPANNLYRIGGGKAWSPTITLSGSNQLSGAGNSVQYANGGTIVVNSDQSYGGVTTISGRNSTSNMVRAATRGVNGQTAFFVSTVLSIDAVANGGASSRLGASSNAASNLVFDGGTLHYTGNGSTDRLFSIGTFGGNIVADGTGPLQFTNTGANASIGDGNRSLRLAGSNGGDNSIAGTLTNPGVGLLAVVKDGAGKWVLSGANTHTGGTTVNAGLLVAENYNNGTLNVAGGVARVSQKGTANSAAGTTKLLDTEVVIAAGGQLDLTNNSMVVDYTGGPNPTLVDTYRQHLLAGRIGTTASTPAGTKIGYADNAAFGTPLATFGGIAVDTDSLLLKYTYAGDSNLDGQVDITDLAALATAWQTNGVWVNGDFDYSGFIDITDLAALATNWQAGVGAPLAQSFEQALASVGLAGQVVPEPGVLALAGLSLGVLSARRRRSR